MRIKRSELEAQFDRELELRWQAYVAHRRQVNGNHATLCVIAGVVLVGWIAHLLLSN